MLLSTTNHDDCHPKTEWNLKSVDWWAYLAPRLSGKFHHSLSSWLSFSLIYCPNNWDYEFHYKILLAQDVLLTDRERSEIAAQRLLEINNCVQFVRVHIVTYWQFLINCILLVIDMSKFVKTIFECDNFLFSVSCTCGGSVSWRGIVASMFKILYFCLRARSESIQIH